MKVYLKVKIKSLTDESRIIREEERKLNIGCRARVKIRRELRKSNTLTLEDRAYLEKRLRAPSERARAAFWGLRHHRIHDVRDEARAAHVAYGFLRGRAYEQIEGPSTVTSPNWGRVEALVKKYGAPADRERFAEWRPQ